jgi:putative oxidoreductase
MSSQGTSGWSLLLVRLAVGTVFVMHGGQKLFVMGYHGVAGFLGQMGFPIPVVAAIVLIAVEFLGGLAVFLGIYTRYAAALLAADMLVAMLVVHLKGGFFLPRGFEYTFVLLLASLALVLSGPGALALGAKIGRR